MQAENLGSQLENWQETSQYLQQYRTDSIRRGKEVDIRCEWRIDAIKAALNLVDAANITDTVISEYSIKVPGLKNTPETGLNHEGKPYELATPEGKKINSIVAPDQIVSAPHEVPVQYFANTINGTSQVWFPQLVPQANQENRVVNSRAEPEDEQQTDENTQEVILKKQPVRRATKRIPHIRRSVAIPSNRNDSHQGYDFDFSLYPDYVDISESTDLAADNKQISQDEAETSVPLTDLFANRPTAIRRAVSFGGMTKRRMLSAALAVFVGAGALLPISTLNRGEYISKAEAAPIAANFIAQRQSSIVLEDGSPLVVSPEQAENIIELIASTRRSVLENSITPPTAPALLREQLKPQAALPVANDLNLQDANTRILGNGEKPRTADDLVRMAQTDAVLQAALKYLGANPNITKDDIKCTVSARESTKCLMDLFGLTVAEASQVISNSQQFAVRNGVLHAVNVTYVDGESSYNGANGGQNFVSNDTLFFVIFKDGKLVIIAQDCVNPLVVNPIPEKTPTATSTSTSTSTATVTNTPPAGATATSTATSTATAINTLTLPPGATATETPQPQQIPYIDICINQNGAIRQERVNLPDINRWAQEHGYQGGPINNDQDLQRMVSFYSEACHMQPPPIYICLDGNPNYPIQIQNVAQEARRRGYQGPEDIRTMIDYLSRSCAPPPPPPPPPPPQQQPLYDVCVSPGVLQKFTEVDLRNEAARLGVDPRLDIDELRRRIAVIRCSPVVATPTPTFTNTPTNTPTATSTATNTPTPPPGATSTETPTLTAIVTGTVPATATATSTATPTPTAAVTGTPTPTPPPGATETPTSIATATTESKTNTPTATALATQTAVNTLTATLAPTPPTVPPSPTHLPTVLTATEIAINTPTSTATATALATQTAVNTLTATLAPTPPTVPPSPTHLAAVVTATSFPPTATLMGMSR